MEERGYEVDADEAYEVLGLKPGASQRKIKTTWRRLSRELHPDVNGGDQEKTERFKRAGEAYDLLDKLGKTGRLFVEHDKFDETQQSSASTHATKPKAHPPFVEFETFEGIVQARPLCVKVRLEQARPAKRPQIQKMAGDFWRAELVEPNPEDHQFGVSFTCTVAASTPVDRYTDTTTVLLVDGQDDVQYCEPGGAVRVGRHSDTGRWELRLLDRPSQHALWDMVVCGAAAERAQDVVGV